LNMVDLGLVFLQQNLEKICTLGKIWTKTTDFVIVV